MNCKSHGFTLLEVLIALAVFAISSTAIISQLGGSLKQQQQLQQKSLAFWVAENQVARLQAATDWPPTGRNTETLEQFNQSWLVNTEVSSTSEPLLRKITVTVAITGQREEHGLAEIIAYRGRY